jgi:hypothetical protein
MTKYLSLGPNGVEEEKKEVGEGGTLAERLGTSRV